MSGNCPPVMLATLGGLLALVAGLGILLLPLLTPELSRPRDATWGALVLLLGLVLVTSSDRLTGAPMLGVLCGGLLIGRLGSEVGQGRWRALTDEERQRLGSAERWRTSVDQLLASVGRLVALAATAASGLLSWWRERRQPRSVGKRWVRPEPGGAAPEPASQAPAAAGEADGAAAEATAVLEVSSFDGVEALLEASQSPADHPAAPASRAEADASDCSPPNAGEVIEPEVIDAPAAGQPPLGTEPLGEDDPTTDEGR